MAWGEGEGNLMDRWGKDGVIEIGQDKNLCFCPGLLRAPNEEQINNNPGALSEVKGISSTAPRVSSNPAQTILPGPEEGI